MDGPRALVFRPLVKGNEALGARLIQEQCVIWLLILQTKKIKTLITSKQRIYVEEFPETTKLLLGHGKSINISTGQIHAAH